MSAHRFFNFKPPAKNYQILRRGYSSSKLTVKGLVLGVYRGDGNDGPKLSSSAEKFNDKMGGKLIELVREYGINGEVGKGKVLNNLEGEFSSVALIGLGREGTGFNEQEYIDEGMENVRIAAGVGARALQMQGCTEVLVDTMDYPEQAAEGSSLAVWRYNKNVRKQNRTKIPKLDLYDSTESDAWTRGLFKGEAQNLARLMSDSPANKMTPTMFAEATVDALCPCGVTVEIRTMDWIEQNRLESFVMIAKGSCEPPVIVEVNYCGTSPEERPVCLLGKGITFNSGGLCLRKKKGMDEYRGSMAGAAICVAAVRAAAALSLPINISAVLPCCENMPSGMSCKPGDVVKLLNGKTIAVRDIDKAGVVVMADPLIYAQNSVKPRLIVDIATLGRGVKYGLGGSATGLFSNSDKMWREFQKAGSITGDRMWRLPLWRYFKKLVTTNVGFDMSNDGYGPASSCLAAAVLHECVPCADWVHLDNRGVGLLTSGTIPYLLKHHMTGRPTRTIIQFLYQMACQEKKK